MYRAKAGGRNRVVVGARPRPGRGPAQDPDPAYPPRGRRAKIGTYRSVGNTPRSQSESSPCPENPRRTPQRNPCRLSDRARARPRCQAVLVVREAAGECAGDILARSSDSEVTMCAAHLPCWANRAYSRDCTPSPRKATNATWRIGRANWPIRPSGASRIAFSATDLPSRSARRKAWSRNKCG